MAMAFRTSILPPNWPFTARMARRRRLPPLRLRAGLARWNSARVRAGMVTSFKEKPAGDGGLINGGFSCWTRP
jgi:hypothetical protein